jgi:hypothetical protein
MTECITIASWMLAVVGFITFISSIYIASNVGREPTMFNVGIFSVSVICLVIGLVACACGIIPYLPCITIIP